MKIYMPCMTCAFPTDGTAPDRQQYSFPVNEDYQYKLVCHRGHETVIMMQEQKFEVLFMIAMNAVVDDYYREAVMSATASLERFYEFTVRVICHAHKVPMNEFADAWKQMSKMSERQFGAFVAAHLLHFQTKPDLMHPKDVEFRNAVVHKGQIPKQEEATNYLTAVSSLIVPMIAKLRETANDSIRAMVGEHLTNVHSKIDKNMKIVTMSGGCPLGFTVQDHSTLEKIEVLVQKLKKSRYGTS